MKIITRYPVLVHGKTINRPKDVSNMDGTSSPANIKQFQNWANKIKYAGLSVDGKWGPKTSAAWDKYGSDFETAAAGLAASLGTTLMGGAPPATSSANASLSPVDPSGKKKAGMLWDRISGGWKKAQDSGKVDQAKNLFNQAKDALNKGKQGTGTDSGPVYESTPIPDAKSSGPTKNQKIGIAIGLTILVLGGLYAMSKTGVPAKK